jgi:Holliday junction DNA helicase RuvB
LADIVGRRKEKERLKVLVDSCKVRNDVMDHIIFYGPPGVGKTTFGYALSKEFGVNFILTSGPSITNKAELASVITNLNAGDFLFIDEIHRLSRVLEEFLYPIMEDYTMDLSVGKGGMSKNIKVDVPKFTLIGATTKIGLISPPLYDRFGNVVKLDFYEVGDLKKIVKFYALKIGIEIEDKAAYEIALRSRGTARIAIRNVKRCYDYALTLSETGYVDLNTVFHTFNKLEIDQYGLDAQMRMYIDKILKDFDGGPVGLNNLAVSIYEDIKTVEDVYEPYLMKLGFIKRTSQGRVATPKCYNYYKLVKVAHKELDETVN